MDAAKRAGVDAATVAGAEACLREVLAEEESARAAEERRRVAQDALKAAMGGRDVAADRGMDLHCSVSLAKSELLNPCSRGFRSTAL